MRNEEIKDCRCCNLGGIKWSEGETTGLCGHYCHRTVMPLESYCKCGMEGYPLDISSKCTANHN